MLNHDWPAGLFARLCNMEGGCRITTGLLGCLQGYVIVRLDDWLVSLPL